MANKTMGVAWCRECWCT